MALRHPSPCRSIRPMGAFCPLLPVSLRPVLDHAGDLVLDTEVLPDHIVRSQVDLALGGHGRNTPLTGARI